MIEPKDFDQHPIYLAGKLQGKRDVVSDIFALLKRQMEGFDAELEKLKEVL